MNGRDKTRLNALATFFQKRTSVEKSKIQSRNRDEYPFIFNRICSIRFTSIPMRTVICITYSI